MKKEIGIIAYIKQHKKVRGIPKSVVDFYTEYKRDKNDNKIHRTIQTNP